MKMENLAKKILYQISTYRYHLIHKNQANSILRSIEIVRGKTEPKLIKLSDEYANDVLGWSGYAPWLYVYSAVAESFKEGWIPDNYFGRIVIPAIKGDYRKMADLKSLTNKLFKKNIFPDIAYYVNGLWVSNNLEFLHEKNVKNNLFKNSNVVVYKLDNSLQGRGVFFFEKDSFDAEKIQHLGNGVFQNYINQHQFFKELMPDSVATLRITTILDDNGNASARACYLRIGRSADTHVQSASHIRIPINLKSGDLDTQGYLTTWLTIDRHPDTNIIFAKKKIPNFNKCLSTALELHKLMPYNRCIGWDMIIDINNNVKVMEWNSNHNDIKFSEATQGPCFSDLGWENLWRKVKSN
jgi:Sugar-transfer associated ATP-grasp